MTAKEYVKQHYPKACVTGYTNRDKSRHWICWDVLYSPTGANRLSCSEKSVSNAWVLAKENIKQRIERTKTLTP